MSLVLDVQSPIGRIALDVQLTTGDGLTALVGHSGAGKTTVLNIVAGLVRPARGTVRWRDEVWVDTDRDVWRPAHARRVGYVFQEPRLFPHLSVRHNLTYGAWFARPRARAVVFDDVVELLGLGPLLGRRPGRLSGGEAQRVAIGRALLSQPRLLLLDEPLASVDVAMRQEFLPYLDRLQTELRLPTIYVTHAFGEIESRAEQVVTLEEGKVLAGSWAGPSGPARAADLKVRPTS
jgi:molybdate transport system ATP-binding protein